jgi:hypothetical protein
VKLSEPEKLKAPVIVLCGATAFSDVNDTKKAAEVKASCLQAPHRFVSAALEGLNVRNIITSSTSCHSILLTDKGCFAWGKNHRGQLGVGDELGRQSPAPVSALAKETVVYAATGKAHTIFITAKGMVYAAGETKFGAVGPSFKKKQETLPTPTLVPGISGAVRAACGADFCMVITSAGHLYSFGWSEFGQLGHGTDGQYNQSASSVKLTFEAEKTPTRVPGLSNVVQVACGPHHCCALTADGTAYTWGAGGYGRLGHLDQADQWRPKALPNVLFRSVACGNTWGSGVGWQTRGPAAARPTGSGMLFMWGRQNPTKDAAMYPKPEYDLQGWDIHHLACGNAHMVVAAESSSISWGSGASFGELGYGAEGPKSSAKAKKIDTLEGAKVGAVACGLAHTLWLAEAPTVAALPVFAPLPDASAAAPAAKGKGKREADDDGKKKAKK